MLNPEQLKVINQHVVSLIIALDICGLPNFSFLLVYLEECFVIRLFLEIDA